MNAALANMLIVQPTIALHTAAVVLLVTATLVLVPTNAPTHYLVILQLDYAYQSVQLVSMPTIKL